MSRAAVPVTRRKALAALAGAPAALAAASRERNALQGGTPRRDVVVVGAGVFGAWTAWQLLRRQKRVLLLDVYGAANSRASSGGESRLTRTIYGADAVYTKMAAESLADWRWLSARAGLPVLHPSGILMFFSKQEPFARESIAIHRELGLPLDAFDRAELARRWPQVAWDGVEFGLHQADYGILMARRAVQTLVAEYVAAGGEYRIAAVEPPDARDGVAGDNAAALESVETSGGAETATEFVFACGPWLPKLFPGLLASRIFPTRQEIFFFAPPRGDDRYGPRRLPGWAEFTAGDIYYGMPDVENRGFKIANDVHGPAFDPDAGDRRASREGEADVRRYLERRFPALAAAPLIETRVCQYENSANGDFLIDRHPAFPNVWLVGGGSGHGFKHGPAVGRYTADLVSGARGVIEPRFSLASKGSVQKREVH
jgi:glycine/D-amino acid oxidase-like deaminating enzyme